jgi:hypothetical protein
MKEEDFAFAVEAVGFQWSVYRFVKDGKKGMMAFTQNEPPSEGDPHGKWIIGMIAAGELTPEQVIVKLQEAALEQPETAHGGR